MATAVFHPGKEAAQAVILAGLSLVEGLMFYQVKIT